MIKQQNFASLRYTHTQRWRILSTCSGNTTLRFTHDITTPPDGFNMAFTIIHIFDFLAKLTDENINDFNLGLIHATIEVVEEHFLGQCGALAQRKQLKHRIFLAGKVNTSTVDFNSLGIKVYRQFAGCLLYTSPSPRDS